MLSSSAQLDITALRDFNKAHRQAWLRQLWSRLTRRGNHLLALESVLQGVQLVGQHSLGLCTVAINQIIGTAGRTEDFDAAFMPRRETSRARWMSVNRAHLDGVPLPPVELRKVGEVYFVMDGHHRISVARQQGQSYVDANVVEIHLPFAVSSASDLRRLMQ